MAALEAPSLDDGATGTGPHTGAESVLALATSHVGLIGTLHSEVSPLGRSRCDREDFGRLNPTSIADLSVTSNREREVAHRTAKSRPYPRNIVGALPGRSLAPLIPFPVIPISYNPYPLRVLASQPSPRSLTTGGFPLLADPAVRDIYSPTLPWWKLHFPGGISGLQQRCGSGSGRFDEFSTPCGQVCGQATNKEAGHLRWQNQARPPWNGRPSTSKSDDG